MDWPGLIVILAHIIESMVIVSVVIQIVIKAISKQIQISPPLECPVWRGEKEGFIG